jgi:hypothetical protein
VCRKNEKGGREESSARNQRRRAEESATRWGSFTGGAAASQEQPKSVIHVISIQWKADIGTRGEEQQAHRAKQNEQRSSHVLHNLVGNPSEREHKTTGRVATLSHKLLSDDSICTWTWLREIPGSIRAIVTR